MASLLVAGAVFDKGNDSGQGNSEGPTGTTTKTATTASGNSKSDSGDMRRQTQFEVIGAILLDDSPCMLHEQ